jgi:hypothetical protein
MTHPMINIQLGHKEVEIKASSVEITALEAIVEAIQNLHYDAVSLRKLLIPYGDPTKNDLYRYGLTIPKNVDGSQFTDWLVEQLRKIQFEDGDSFQINRLQALEKTSS